MPPSHPRCCHDPRRPGGRPAATPSTTKRSPSSSATSPRAGRCRLSDSTRPRGGIGSRPARTWLDSVRGWLVRVGQAATAAVALTVVGALVAVLLLRPPAEPGTSPDPSDRATGPQPTARRSPRSPSSTSAATCPTPRASSSRWSRATLPSWTWRQTGARGPAPIGADIGSVLRWRRMGPPVPVREARADANTRPTEAVITIDRFDESARCSPASERSPWSATPIRATARSRSDRHTWPSTCGSARAADSGSSAGASGSTRSGRTGSPSSTSPMAAR